MASLRVDVSREFVLTREIGGVEIEKPTGLVYVDVYFPDGTQRTCGYIGKDLNGAFAPLAGIDKDLADLIQAEINKAAGHAPGTGPSGPPALPAEEIIDGDEDES